MCGYNSYHEERKPLDNEIVQISGKEYKELLIYKEMFENRDCSWPKGKGKNNYKNGYIDDGVYSYRNNSFSTQAFNPYDNAQYDRE